MKKILYNILLFLFVLIPTSVFADGHVSVSSDSLTIEKGSTKSFAINVYNAIGDIYIKSNDSNVASVNISEWGTGIIDEKQTKSVEVVVTGNNVGTTSIVLIVDAASFGGEDLSDQTKTITISVVDKKETSSLIQPSSPDNNNELQNTLSNNNNLKSLSVEGYKLKKENDNNYTLIVDNHVTNINVTAITEDSKAKISGIGLKELQVGENNIELIVTSESGIQNKINVKVTRKDGYYLEDLDSILKFDELEDLNIIITDYDRITKEQMTKIKDSRKKISLDYYDKNNKLIYRWTINGNKIEESKEFSTLINFISENVDDIYKLSNYADGLYVNLKNAKDIPNGTKIVLYVGNKFKNDSNVNIYCYNDSKKTLISINTNLKVVDGYVEFDVDKSLDYFITMSTINNDNSIETRLSIFIALTIVELVAIIVIVVFILKKRK